MTAATSLPVDSYVRVSRVGDRSGESYISPDVQREANAACAKRLGYTLRDNPAEENESGGTMDRPTFQTIMQRIRDGESAGIVVYRLDRFARTLVGGYAALTEIAQHGAVFASASEAQFDFASASGRMTLQMHLMMAEYFRQLTRDSWATSVQRAVDRGVHPAPYGAYGYERTGGHLIPGDEAPYVLEAFRLRVEDHSSYGAIAAWLNENAPPRRYIEKSGQVRTPPWTGPAVQRMLQRRVYLGEAFYRVQSSKDGGDPIVNRDAHEPIVPEGLFMAAQEAVHTHSKARGGEVALLGGIVRCAGCRYVLSPGIVGAKDSPYRRRMYRCRKHHVSGECPAPASVTAERLEEFVEAVVCEMLDAGAAHAFAAPDDDERATVEQELTAARADIEAMRQDTEARKRLGTRWLEFLDPYLAREESALARLTDLHARSGSVTAELTSERYRTLPRDERRSVLSSMVGSVIVRKATGPRGRHSTPMDADRVCILSGPETVAQGFPAKSRDAGGVRSWDWPEGESKAGVLPAKRAA